jgi:hypothetical protein
MSDIKKFYLLGKQIAQALCTAQGLSQTAAIALPDAMEGANAIQRFGFNQEMRRQFDAGTVSILIQDQDEQTTKSVFAEYDNTVRRYRCYQNTDDPHSWEREAVKRQEVQKLGVDLATILIDGGKVPLSPKD